MTNNSETDEEVVRKKYPKAMEHFDGMYAIWSGGYVIGCSGKGFALAWSDARKRIGGE